MPKASAQERAALIAAMVTAALIIVQQIGAKTLRDTYFLSTHSASELPEVMIGAALMSLVFALAYSRLLKALGPARALPMAYAVHASLFVVEWWLSSHMPGMVAVLLYLHIGALGPILISGFWSLVNELFDPHTAKKYVSRVAASAALGGVVGGVAAERLITNYELTVLLPGLAGVTLAAGALAHRIGRSAGMLGEPADRESAARTLKPTNYLRDLALLVLVSSTMSGLLDFALKAEASGEFVTPDSLGAFFALYHAALSVLVFLVQSLLVAGALKNFGIAGTIALLPGSIIVASVLGISVPRLWTVALVTGLETVLRNSLFRSGYELLYTPVDKARKRAAKTIIDVGFDRVGDVAAAGLALASITALPSEANRMVIAFGVLTAALGLLLSLRLHRGYVAELAASLRSGTVSLTDVSGLDATTRQTLNDATLAIDRQQLLERIQELQAQKAQAADAAPRSEPAAMAPTQPGSVLDQARTLLSGDEQEVGLLLEAAQKTASLDALLIPLITPLLARQRLARPALSVLQRHCRGREGVLMDVLLDQSQPEVVRRRIPRVFRELGTARARDGLMLGLEDPNLGVRYYSAQALFRLVAKHRELAPARERIFALVGSEAQATPREWARPLYAEESDNLATEQPRQPEGARLEYVFFLLGTVLDAEPLELCLKAVASGDRTLKGTALEYLEHVLPTRVHTALGRHILEGHSERRQKQERKTTVIVQDLQDSVVKARLDLDLYRKLPTSDDP